MGLKLSVVIPVYNEEKRAPAFLKRLIEYLSTNFDSFEVIVVNDGSTDATLNLVEDIAKGKEYIKIISYPKNRGKGIAIRQGVLSAVGEKIIFMDGDGAFLPENLPRFIEALDDCGLVLGKKRHSKLSRRILSVIFTGMVRLLFFLQIGDVLCGLKGFNKNVAKQLFSDIRCEGPIFDIEVLMKAKGKYKIAVLSVDMLLDTDRNLKLKYMLSMMLELLRLKSRYIFGCL